MKSKQNKYSQLYAKIDRKQLSEQALATLDKLRLATGNFRTKNQESLDLFQEFYDKLSEKKPTAIKGSPENKAMIKEMLKERGRKLAEGRKAKQKEKTEGKSEGNEIDANRPAKPFGWRMRGKHNYKKPTRADITEGRAYYEGRVNRADVKRKKYPMLERGGMAEEVYYVNDFYPNYDEDKIAQVLKDNGFKKVRKGKKYGWSNQPDVVVFQGDKNKAKEVLEKEFDNYISINEKDWGRKYEEGGEINGNYLNSISADKKERILKNIAKHYGISMSEAEAEVKDSDAEMLYEYIANDNGLRMAIYNDIENKKYEHGGMAEGGDVDKGGMIYALREFVSSGEIANKTDVLNYDDIAKIRRIAIQYYIDNGDVNYSYQELGKVLSYANDKFKSGMYAKGGMAKNEETSKKRYVKSSYNSKSLIDDKNKASKYFLNDAEYMLKSYGNAKVEKVDNSLPDGVGMNYIVVIESYKKYAKGGYMAKGGEVHVVLNEGNGKIINKLYNDWNNVKSEQEYKKWVDEVRSTKFGTYGTITYDEVLKKFNFDNAPINSFHLKSFKAELKNALNKDYKYEEGGEISKKVVFSFSFNTDNISLKEVINLVKPYSKDWRTSGDISEVNFFITLKQADALNLRKELKSYGYFYDFEMENSRYEDGGYMAKGGYVSKGELVWKKLTRSERMDFLNKNFTPQITPRSQETLVGKDYNFLPKNVKIVMESKYANVEDYAKGGAIENQYEGRNVEDIWNNLSKSQRSHFIYDHAEEIEEYRGEEYGELTSKEIIKSYNADWSELDKNIKNRFRNHTREGQYEHGGEMDDEEGVDLFEDYEDQPKEVSDLLETLEVEDYNYDTLNDLLSKMKKIGYTFEFGLDAEPYDLRKIGQKGKSEFYAKGGKLGLNTYKLRAEGLNDFLSFLQTGMYMRMKYFTIEPIGVPEVIVTFVTDASLSEIKSKLKEVQDSHVMLETLKPIDEYTGERDEMMAKGGTIGGMSTYVSARDIEEIKLTISGDMKTLKGADLMDGVYVKKASLKAKFDAYEVYNKLSDMASNVWDKLNIESGSQIYNSDSIQKKLQVECEKAGIDSLFKSLTKAQRKKVAEILTDENQHSLRNYLALRGYEGEMEYNSYKDGYDNMPKDRKYYISPYVITRVVTMAEGGEVFYTEKHKND